MRAGVLPVEPVVLPEVLRGRSGVPGPGPGGLVPELQHDPGAGAGGGRRPSVRAVRHAGGEEGPGAVVLPHHEVRGRAAGLLRDRLAGADHHHAAELDRPERGGGGHLHRPRAGRLPAPPGGVHHAAGHALGRHLHGAGARAPVGARPHRPGPAGGGGGVHVPGPPSERDRPDEHGAGEDGGVFGQLRHQPRQRPARPHLDRGLRAHGLRDGGHHGRAGPRPAGLRVRPQVRPARAGGDPAPGGAARGASGGRVRGARADGELGSV
ncbi:hypothetical protein HRbin31_00847 [bacterium HR31]|nr:hypothetical protein HRbin31_00847 [bacterium HR31]